MIILWIFFGWAGGEIIGVTIINLLVPVGLGLGAYGQRRVNIFHLAEVSVAAKQLKGHGSEYHL